MDSVYVCMRTGVLPAQLLANFGNARPQLRTEVIGAFVVRHDRQHVLERLELGLRGGGCAKCTLGRVVVRRQIRGHTLIVSWNAPAAPMRCSGPTRINSAQPRSRAW